MQIIKTILWTFLAVIAAGFVAFNWGEKVPVAFWPLENEPVVFDWPVGFIAVVFFLLGFLPIWLYHRATKWRLHRRISSLESAFKSNNAPAEPAVPPSAAPADDPLSPNPASTGTP